MAGLADPGLSCFIQSPIVQDDASSIFETVYTCQLDDLTWFGPFAEMILLGCGCCDVKAT